MTIGKLSVILGLQTNQYTAGLDKAEKKTTSFGGKVRGMRAAVSKNALKMGLSMAAAAEAAMQAMDRLVIAQAAVIDQQAKFSRRLGMTVQSLRELQFAAGESGVAANTLQMALQRMTRRMATAAGTKGGSVNDALEKLNLNAREMVGLSPDEMFKSVADAMEGVGTQAERVALAFALFDSEGVRVLQMMENGAAGLEAAAAKFAAVTVPLTGADVALMEEITDNVNEYNAALESLNEQAALAARPLTKFRQEVKTEFVVGATQRIKQLRDAYEGFFDTVRRMTIGGEGFRHARARLEAEEEAQRTAEKQMAAQQAMIAANERRKKQEKEIAAIAAANQRQQWATMLEMENDRAKKIEEAARKERMIQERLTEIRGGKTAPERAMEAGAKRVEQFRKAAIDARLALEANADEDRRQALIDSSVKAAQAYNRERERFERALPRMQAAAAKARPRERELEKQIAELEAKRVEAAPVAESAFFGTQASAQARLRHGFQDPRIKEEQKQTKKLDELKKELEGIRKDERERAQAKQDVEIRIATESGVR